MWSARWREGTNSTSPPLFLGSRATRGDAYAYASSSSVVVRPSSQHVMHMLMLTCAQQGRHWRRRQRHVPPPPQLYRCPSAAHQTDIHQAFPMI